MCARRRSNFLLSRQEKVTKEKATLLCASLRCAAGNLRCSVRGCHRRTRCAPAALRSNNCGESVHEVRVSFGTRTHPLPCASRHAQKGTQRTSIRAIALLGPVCAARGACAREMGPSEAMARVDVRLSTPLLDAPATGRLRGEHGRRSAHASFTDSPCLTARRAPAHSVFQGAPPNRPGAGRPFAPRRGRRLGVAFSLVTFFWRSKRKLLARRATPGPRPKTKHASPTSAPRLRRTQPERITKTQSLSTK